MSSITFWWVLSVSLGVAWKIMFYWFFFFLEVIDWAAVFSRCVVLLTWRNACCKLKAWKKILERIQMQNAEMHKPWSIIKWDASGICTVLRERAWKIIYGFSHHYRYRSATVCLNVQYIHHRPSLQCSFLISFIPPQIPPLDMVWWVVIYCVSSRKQGMLRRKKSNSKKENQRFWKKFLLISSFSIFAVRKTNSRLEGNAALLFVFENRSK